MQSSDENKAYKCKFCSRYFLNKRDFKEHKRQAHGEELRLSTPTPSETAPSPQEHREEQSSTAPPEQMPPPSSPPEASSSARAAKRKSKRLVEQENQTDDTQPETTASTSKTKDTSSQKKRPESKTVSKNFMPLQIGKKRKVVGEDGRTRTEWFRNPKFKGA